MAVPNADRQSQKPRELRRRVMLRARMRSLGGWSNACILNVSSRGLMINAGAVSALSDGSIELWHGDHLIVGTIVWRKGTRAGLRTETSVPVEAILASGEGPALQLTAPSLPSAPRKVRGHGDSRIRARAIEFAGIGLIAASLSAGALWMAEQAFAKPLVAVEAALSGG